MTFLLEYMYGTRLIVTANDLSEEYLNYTTNLVSGVNGDGDFFDKLDAGYQTWGIIPELTVPYQSTPVGSVSQDILNTGKRWTRFKAFFIKSWDSSKGATQSELDLAIRCLDQNIPVAFGGWWFRSGKWSTYIINGIEVMDVPATSQKTIVLEDGHSVPLVGYRRDTAFPGGGYFVFRNSWGQGWGDNGYGYMPFAYVLNYANDLVAYKTKDIFSAHIGIQAVIQQKDKLDIFVTDNTGVVHGASWQQNILAGKWRGWWSILDGKAKKGTPVTVVARDSNRLDVFVAGVDGKTYTAAWDHAVTDSQWRGWWNILTGNIPAGGAVSAVVRDPNKLDVFLVSTDGGIYTAAWDQHVAEAKWRGWWRILNGVAAPGSQVAAVSRDANKLDVFVIGTDSGIYTAAWDQHVAEAKWRGWWRILNGVAAPGSQVAAVSRDVNKLDAFVIGTDGGIWTAAWDQNVAEAKWRGWWRILDGVAAPGSSVTVVSRDPDKLDVFVIGTDGGIWTAAWDQNVAEAKWRGWWRILGGVAAPGSGVTVVSRDPDKLDVFVIGTDGGIWTAAWDQNVAEAKWRGWWRIGS
jgi:hypothetical protein